MADIIHIVGGRGIGDVSLPTLEYLSQTDEWQSFDSPTTEPWYNLGLVSIGAYIYALGGDLQGVPTDITQAAQAIYTVAIPLVR